MNMRIALKRKFMPPFKVTGGAPVALPNPINYWKLEDVSDSVDASPLTITGAVGFAAGKHNNGATYGANPPLARLSGNVITSINPVLGFSFSMWVHLGVIYNAPVALYNATDGSYVVYILLSNASSYFRSEDGAGGSSGNVNLVGLNANAWNHIVFVGVAGNTVARVNGGAATADSHGLDYIANPTILDYCYFPMFTNQVDFMLDELSLWDVSLTDIQCASLWNASAGRFYPF